MKNDAMNALASPATTQPTLFTPRVLVPLALLAVYLLWGSTYLAIRVALVGYPPFFMAAIRVVRQRIPPRRLKSGLYNRIATEFTSRRRACWGGIHRDFYCTALKRRLSKRLQADQADHGRDHPGGRDSAAVFEVPIWNLKERGGRRTTN